MQLHVSGIRLTGLQLVARAYSLGPSDSSMSQLEDCGGPKVLVEGKGTGSKSTAALKISSHGSQMFCHDTACTKCRICAPV